MVLKDGIALTKLYVPCMCEGWGSILQRQRRFRGIAGWSVLGSLLQWARPWSNAIEVYTQLKGYNICWQTVDNGPVNTNFEDWPHSSCGLVLKLDQPIMKLVEGTISSHYVVKQCICGKSGPKPRIRPWAKVMLAGFQKITRNLRVSISAVLVKIEMGSFFNSSFYCKRKILE